MNRSPKSIAALVVALLALPGCALVERAPERPAMTLPAEYRSAGDTPGTPAAASVDDAWWRALGDATLDRLVERALADNPDVAAAAARIAAARAEARLDGASTRPQLGAYGTSQRVQQSGNGLFGAATQSGAFPDLYTLHDVGLDASWELDVFGVGRARQRGAAARLRATAAERDALRLSLSAEVVRTYVEHLVVAQQADALRRALADTAQYQALVEEQVGRGDASEQAVAAARQAVFATRAELALLTARRESLRHAMGALLGSGEYVELPQQSPMLDEASRVLATAVRPGTPSDLLRRRPDLARAEAQFQQAVAARREAIADQYPRFVLLGGVGQQALQSGDLLRAASEAWNLAAQITLPVLDGGRRAAVRSQREAQLDEATASYRAAVIEALSDVERSMLTSQATLEAMRAQQARLAEAQRFREAEQSRHDLGDTALTELLMSRVNYERVLIEDLAARADALSGYVRLRKSLGGAT